ncbi:phospholipid-translocating P-type ATPase [Backusella circina FSU 941]|nr:phospholipid-translocating P-type ATPase [Backusella circina FSU 941]
MKISPRSKLFLKRRKEQEEDNDSDKLKRTESTSSYMQKRRNIYVNMELPLSEFDDNGKQIKHYYASNRVRTAKYTPLTYIPKNLFEQFRNVANLYFLFIVILQCIPLFGVAEPAVSALPLICILIITGIKDGIEDLKRHQSDNRVNNSKTLRLSDWKNVNVPEVKKGTWYFLHVIIGFFSVLSGAENKYTASYRHSKKKGNQNQSASPQQYQSQQSTENEPKSSEDKVPLNEDEGPSQPQRTLLSSVRKRSDTIRSLSNIFKPNHSNSSLENNKPYRPGAIPHSVLYRVSSTQSNTPPVGAGTPGVGKSESFQPKPTPLSTTVTRADNDNNMNNTSGESSSTSSWEPVKWKDIVVGDYVLVKNDDEIPADIVILSTSETDNVCYVETQNLDGETNLKQRQGLPGTVGIRSEEDCEHASFYIESEPPHVNLYQYNAVLRWQIDATETATMRSGVSHEKADAVTYNNIMLRGCVLRNTEWAIGIVVYTGDDTKIMLNSGRTPSKRSKMQKATNPHVIANFVILAVISIISSIMDSVQFNASGSSRYFDFDIEGNSASYSGFVTFWVTLILYQNIVPISLYISVEIVKTIAAYFIFADIDMYYEPTDTPCIPKTWNISDDLGQVEYIFSDKTGTLTQNVMEYRKCTINGVSYGIATTEATLGAMKRQQSRHVDDALDLADHETGLHMDDLNNNNANETDPHVLEELKEEMYEKQSKLFDNPHLGPNPTFVDPKIFDDLKDENSPQSVAITHFYQSLALCHTVIAEYPDEENPDQIEYKAQSPDEAALVATARDLGFAFLRRDANRIYIKVKGEEKEFTVLNVLEFNSTRKRMSIIIQPAGSDRIVLLCKGADSVIYERLCTEFGNQKELADDQSHLRDSTSRDLEEFANEGLRTLCLSYRFISPEEYKPWNRRYQEAAASIHNREERVDAICEEIEINMLLMGGTAIEDRLQDGVPETISELARSGIKLWVLTGDKTETAINIGFACNLLTLEMELLVLRATNREDTVEALQETIDKIKNETNPDKKYALVIDGTTLKYALEPATKDQVLGLGMRCSSVICCRVSPKQKAQVVNLVKKGLKVMTLAIGDGANDVAMIQEANVGIGISGVEGRQAVMASDYAIAQFRYLRKLLLVHGRWSYIRISNMIFGFFYKNAVWTFVLFWYQIFCQFNGSMLFDYALVTLYNLIFTSLPIIFMGVWDQDLSAKISQRYPELYRMGLRNDKYKVWQFWVTIFDATYQSAVCFFFPYMLLIGGQIDPSGHDANGLYEIGTIISSIAVIVANFYVVVSLYSFTWIQVVIVSLSILVYYAFVGIYSQFNYFIFCGHVRLFGTGLYWLIMILTIVACYIPRMAVKFYLQQYHPYDNDVVREIELVIKPHEKETVDSEKTPTSSYQFSKEP